eukprot:Unigene2335_Nuclearia_a/m.7228 Unigene2335_Nuclearia_a/g.7228  ORF Unigene2335_Nuclearia_a/g.7228 Unigene2335_Nuclearia_a/m.7228 type:complete len:132 (-) Unigene2335_Nuclearia_a:200-595(-)
MPEDAPGITPEVAAPVRAAPPAPEVLTGTEVMFIVSGAPEYVTGMVWCWLVALFMVALDGDGVLRLETLLPLVLPLVPVLLLAGAGAEAGLGLQWAGWLLAAEANDEPDHRYSRKTSSGLAQAISAKRGLL